MALDLISESPYPESETLSLVAESDGGEIAGHVVFSPVRFHDRKKVLGYILAPLGVSPEFQKQGIGSMLIRHGLERFSQKDVQMFFVYGDPGYYGKFGFDAEDARKYRPAFDLEFPFGWQALVLQPFDEEEKDMEESGQTVHIAFLPPLQNPDLW